ncbi:hypothetical protein GCM10023311_15240 [Flaviramulus aquimarinus]|uniref:Glycosyl hydrolase family 16 n=1 Tax=Flaviramulus aquimarinus TaxID=1170456 RepID=A0ABP9F121_9FLAO
MKNIKNSYTKTICLLAMVFITALSCERDISDDAVPATFAPTAEVFIDGFSGGMQFQAFGDIYNFNVDNDVVYKGLASMRFAVPAEGETGSFAGGNFFTGGANPDGTTFYAGGRDLSEFDALTFWAKSSMPAEIDEVGFGLNPDQGSVFRVSLKNVAVNSNWKKYYIPIPDASKLTGEQGLFYYFEGPEQGLGYTFWIDELQFEKLGTFAHAQPLILNGNDETTTGFNTVEIPLTGVGASFNLPNGINQTIELTPAYFTFSSSDEAVATVNDLGIATVNSEGTAIITASLGEFEAQGSLTIESAGAFLFAPTPTQDEADVISLFSNNYTNVSGYTSNLFWEPYQTTLSADFNIAGDDIINYIEFNFVGNQLTDGLLDASGEDTFHFDVFIPGDVAGAQLRVALRDFGDDGAEGGGDDGEIAMIISSFTAGEWNSFDMPLGATGRSNLGFIVWENLNSTLTNLYIDNIYFY